MKSFQKYILLICFICSQALWAQYTFEAKVSRENVPLNEHVRIDFVMDGDGDNFTPPNFNGLKIVGGPNQAVSQSWINGKKTFSKTYSYFLQSTRKGNFKIGPATIEIEGKEYKTNPLSITFVDAVQKQNTPNRGRSGELNQIQQQSLEHIHLVTEVSNANPYVNEPVNISFKIYFKEGLSGYSGKKIPTYKDFWVHTIPPTRQPEIKVGKYKGETYNYIEIKRDVVMAQEVGSYTIDPLVLDVQAQVYTGRRDFFGFPEVGYVEKEIGTNKVTINSKALPEQGKPLNFSGGVGKLNFKVTPSKRELKAGDPFTLKVEVSGQGNLNLLTIPEPKAHSALELYDPVYTEKVTPTVFGLQGKRANEYTIIPQYKGDYYIQPMEFSYFDLSSKSYKTISTDSLKIAVIDGPALPTNTTIQHAQDSEAIDNSELFQPIENTATFISTESETAYWLSTTYYLLTLFPIAAIPFFVLAVNRKRSLDNDIEGNRLRTNNRLARKYLSEAKKHLKDKDSFYEALERCLHNFLKAKLKIETSEMSNETIQDLLQDNQVTEEQITAFMELKNACEWARYTPTEQVDTNKDYESAIQVISQLEKQLK
ncbi:MULTISPECIES: BatD family protein [Myroides]|uniref:Protein BatD n=1 Tax=Myroides albus TaxID=2562892 RepID=A0A6I3LJD5_9FLAO|nr:MULTISPECIES: BatD family protein [Myroides]MTG97924.1 protein BatD [Myroides albus]MVX37310.1 protein BatD [Myroides sp. LoEW2-1]UVD81112.1 BatD family protein [Myroides albus]